MNRIRGIIFDMDNTLLKSAIDFEGMKQETFRFLVSRGVLSTSFPFAGHTSSTIIEAAVKTGRMTEELLAEMWAIPQKFELAGMEGAALEPGVAEFLEELHGSCRLTIVTNNSYHAAVEALTANRIFDYFEIVAGREQMRSLKPSPDGFRYVLDQFVEMAAADWISVGDAWIDGKASMEAGVPFVSYRGDADKMNRMGVQPIAFIRDIRELRNYL